MVGVGLVVQIMTNPDKTVVPGQDNNMYRWIDHRAPPLGCHLVMVEGLEPIDDESDAVWTLVLVGAPLAVRWRCKFLTKHDYMTEDG